MGVWVRLTHTHTGNSYGIFFDPRGGVEKNTIGVCVVIHRPRGGQNKCLNELRHFFLLILCGRHVIRKAIWRISKLEIRNLKSAVSALFGCLSFACFEKKWGKVSWIFRNSSFRHITNSFSHDMPTTFVLLGLILWLKWQTTPNFKFLLQYARHYNPGLVYFMMARIW